MVCTFLSYKAYGYYKIQAILFQEHFEKNTVLLAFIPVKGEGKTEKRIDDKAKKWYSFNEEIWVISNSEINRRHSRKENKYVKAFSSG